MEKKKKETPSSRKERGNSLKTNSNDSVKKDGEKN